MFRADGRLDVEALAAAVDRQLASQGRVLLFVNDPCHNPTGYSMRRDEWAALVDALSCRAERGPITLLVDTAYFLYGSSPDPRAFVDELRPLLGRIGLLFAWSASKSFTHYGLRVGALVACEPDRATRDATAAALSFACRGTWSNCNRGGMALVARLLGEPALRASCDAEREAAKALLMRRVAAFNAAAGPRGLRYPRYEGGFFVTVFRDDAAEHARRMRERHGVYAVPQAGGIRVALCAIATADVPRLVDALAD
jgi:aspartate/tyrosine/aromatic aminotransferase